jgi:hypothetical protein
MWRRVPCEQPLHTGQSILSPRRNPMLMVAGCFDMPKSDAGQRTHARLPHEAHT